MNRGPSADTETFTTGAEPRRPGMLRFGLDASTLEGPHTPGALAEDRTALGIRVGRYALLSKLGEGGMGAVYSGFDERLDRRVAIKVVRAPLVGDRVSRLRIHREAQALARLSHPNVVQIYDIGEVDDQLFLAMEFVKGETLRAFQERHDPDTPAGLRALLDVYMQAGRGLAAAHGAGIVHRDFKPTNVLVGEDGRARVLDFGLAARDAPSAPRDSPPAPAALLDGDLTSTGTVLGTPAYMAPEQFLALEADHRADIFAFSIALHEALYREPPFDGVSFAARQQAVVDGQVREPPPTSRVPPWLRLVVARGLARAPADRYPTMDEMLAALADDPLERRRRRRRALGLGLGLAAMLAALVLTGLWGWQRWQLARADARADERLAAVEERIAEHLAAGAADLAERAFFAFVDHPDNRGRAALGRAWLGRATRAQERGDAAAAVDAYASGYTVATVADDQTAALVGLARIFRDERRTSELLLSLATLDERGQDPGPELDALRLDAALGSRDFEGAAALLRGPFAGTPRAALVPVLGALGRATPSAQRHRGSAARGDLDGDGRDELILRTNLRRHQLAPVVRAEPGLPLQDTLGLALGFQVLAPGAGEPVLLVSGERHARDGRPGHDVTVSRRERGRLVELLRWPENPVLSALSADVDGDGARELYIGTGPYSRRLTELRRGADGSWSTHAAAPDIDRRRSDVVDLLADDLDGDGVVEVVAALGPWTAYELGVLRHDPATDTLRTFTRRRIGTIAGAAIVRRGPGGPEIAVSKIDQFVNAKVFPRDRPHGDPAGVYFFRLVDDALEQTGFVPAPRLPAGTRVLSGPPIAADLDGDGRDELVVACGITDTPSAPERDSLLVLVTAADGTTTSLVLGGLRPIAAHDLDGDGDHELLVSDAAHGTGEDVWVLGAGDTALPRITALAAQRDQPPGIDPTLAQMWSRAEDLARIGLTRQAADGFVQVAEQSAAGVRARALARAAELHEQRRDDIRAARLFADAADDPVLSQVAHRAAAHAFLRVGAFERAAEHAAAAGDPASTVVPAALAALGDERIELTFDQPLAGGWRIGQPLALRRDGARRTLHVDTPAAGELLSAPVRWAGGSVALEADLELARIEWDSDLTIGIVRDGTGLEDGSSPLGFNIAVVGGGTERFLELACMSYGRSGVARLPFSPERGPELGRITLRAVLLPDLGEWTCTIARASGEPILYERNRLPLEYPRLDALRLAVRSDPGFNTRFVADIHRVLVRGAGLADTAPDGEPSLLAARRAFVEDEHLEVLEALARTREPGAHDRLLEVVALSRLGRLDEAARLLAPLTEDDTLGATFGTLLRSDPTAFGAIYRSAAGPTAFREALAITWSSAVRIDQDPAAFAVVWSGLAERDLERDVFEILRIHALAAAALGHRASAEASYRAALVALADPTRRRGTPLPLGATEFEAWGIRLDLAAMALAAGDEEAARAELRPTLAAEHLDPLVVDRLRARDDLRPLWDLAAKP